MFKSILFFIILCCSFSLLANQFTYDSMDRVPGYEAKFVISHSQSSTTTGELDCQSFIQRLDIFNKKNELINENIINYYECENLYLKYSRCLESTQSVCIDSTDILSSSCQCK